VLGAAAFVVLEEVLSSWTTYWHLPFGALLIGAALWQAGALRLGCAAEREGHSSLRETFSTSSPRRRGSRARFRKYMRLLICALDSRFRGNDDSRDAKPKNRADTLHRPHSFPDTTGEGRR
jgi:hypothetical protein